jgi:hypothetical protein
MLKCGGEAAFFNIARRSGRSTFRVSLLRSFHSELFDEEGPAGSGIIRANAQRSEPDWHSTSNIQRQIRFGIREICVIRG